MIRSLALLTLLAVGCGPKNATTEGPVSVTQEGFSTIHGTWAVHPDPREQISFDPIYSNTQIVIGEEEYHFSLDRQGIALSGPYTILNWDGRKGSIKVDYGNNRTNQINIERLGDASPADVIVVTETADRIAPKYMIRVSSSD